MTASSITSDHHTYVRLSSPAETFALDLQEEEENFDLAVIASLEIDVIPYVGDARVPDALVSQLSRILKQGSALYEGDFTVNRPSTADSIKTSSSTKSDLTKVDVTAGTTDFGSLLPRERFSYWCFDLLFLICSDTTHGTHSPR